MARNVHPAPFRGLAAGVAGGLLAALAMNQFQKWWVRVAPKPESNVDPATVRAANKASRKLTGDFLDKKDKPLAGEATHFAFGAALGGLYGFIAEYRPEITKGFGTGFGTTAALVFDEGAVPAVGLTQPPTEFGPATHLYSLASHLVFGAVTEATRRSLRAATGS